jgi:flagella basal body P-ring formation protein FlgA
MRVFPAQRNALLGVLALALFMTGLNGTSHAAAVERAAIEDVVTAHVLAVAEEKDLLGEDGLLSVDVLQIPGWPFEFKDAETPEDITLSASSHLEMYFASQALVRVKMEDPTGRVREIGVPVRVAISKPVWVSKTVVMPGQALSPKDFKLETKEITSGFDRLIGADFNLEKYAARVMLRPGQVLDAGHVVRPPAVQRNAVVTLIMRGANGMRIVVEGKSLEDGQIGQKVRVKNHLNNQKYYTGKVIGENQVQVSM